MKAARIGATLLVIPVLATSLGACGSGGQHVPDLTKLPLVEGARIVAQSRKCDPGANAYCGLEIVVVAPKYRTSNDLLLGEHDHLKALGWTGANAEIGGERAADSPKHTLHLSFATADVDLKGVELGYIKRSRTIQLALSHSIFERVPTLSMLLEEGTG